MLRLLHRFTATVWEILLVVPMPWRAAAVLWLATVASYHLGHRFLALLLLPEFWITNLLRRWGWRPLPGTYAFGRAVEWSIRILRASVWLALVIPISGIVAWYVRPLLEDTALAHHIDQGVDWWYSLEESILASR
jgi:hypothetical protein